MSVKGLCNRRPVRVGLVAGALLLASGARAEDFTPIELTISGGISLGSYEAGLNWALLRQVKRQSKDGRSPADGSPPPKLVAVVGASAGNINALLAALEWCKVDDGTDSPEKNLFWESWIPIGYDRLFAGDLSCEQYAQKWGLGDLLQCRVTCQQDSGRYKDDWDCSEGGSAYRPDDGLFARRAFAEVEANFQHALESAHVDPACRLAIGVTTTKVRPAQMVVSTTPQEAHDVVDADHCYRRPRTLKPTRAGITIESQRFVTALQAETRGKDGFGFYEHAFCDDTTLGEYLHLPKLAGTDEKVAARDLLDLTEASSAFPGAFGPKRMRYCKLKDGSTAGAAGSSECAPAESLEEDFFVDGGFFDNRPLGLGYSLTGRMTDKLKGSPKVGRQFFYIDPDHRRYVSANPGQASSGMTGAHRDQSAVVKPGISGLTGFFGSFFGVAGQYELQTVSRYVWRAEPGQPEPRLDITGRMNPIVGEYLGAFAAFLAKPFRQFDFYVGVYDGVYTAADWACDLQLGPDAGPGPEAIGKVAGLTRGRCLLDQMLQGYHDIGLDQSRGPAARVFHALLSRELSTWSRLSDAKGQAELAKLSAKATQWSREQGFDPEEPSDDTTLEGLLRATGALVEEEIGAALGDKKAAEQFDKHKDDFAYFLQLLGSETLSEQKAFTQEEQNLLADPSTFLRRTALQLVDRQRAIEHADGNQTTGSALAATQWVLVSQLADVTLGFQWDPSSIPDDNLHLPGKIISRILPYRVSTDFHSLVEGGFEPTWGLSSRFALVFPGTFAWNWRDGSAAMGIGIGGLYRTHNGWLSGIDLSARPSYQVVAPSSGGTTFQDRSLVGAELGVRGLGGKVRLSLALDGIRPFGDASVQQPALSFRAGLVDFNGTAYWIGRIVLGR